MTKVGDITVTNVVYHEDGSATVTFNMDNDALRRFVEIGVLTVLMDTVAEHEQR